MRGWSLGSWPVSAPPGQARRWRRPLCDDNVARDTNALTMIIRETNSHIGGTLQLGPRWACPNGAMTEPLPKLHHHTPKLSVGLAPTEATTQLLLRHWHHPPISHSLRGDKPHGGEGKSRAALGSWPVSAPLGQAQRGPISFCEAVSRPLGAVASWSERPCSWARCRPGMRGSRRARCAWR